MIEQANKQQGMNKRPPISASRHEQQRRKMYEPLANFEDIFEERWMVSRSDTRMDNKRAKVRYPALFQKYDLAVGRGAGGKHGGEDP